jgi:hypothetical protein
MDLKDKPSLHGKMLGEALAAMADLGRRDAPMVIPPCCGTCAFRRGAMPNLMAGTGKLALDCVLGIDRDRFACHHDMKNGEPKRICFGYVAALLAPYSEVREIITALYEQLRGVDNTADQVSAAFDTWLEGAAPERRMDVYELARQYAKAIVESV